MLLSTSGWARFSHSLEKKDSVLYTARLSTVAIWENRGSGKGGG